MRKGSIDYVTLAVALVPMLLFIFFSAYFIQQRGVTADLSAQVNYDNKKYQTLALSASILHSKDIRQDLGYYPVASDSERQDLRNSIEGRVRPMLSRQSREFTFILKNRDTGEELIRIEQGGGGDTGSTVHVPSPSSDKITLTVRLGEQSLI